jgi:hypothetical protein
MPGSGAARGRAAAPSRPRAPPAAPCARPRARAPLPPPAAAPSASGALLEWPLEPRDEFRRGVGLCVVNARGEVFAGRRADDPGSWQMPQGGEREGLRFGAPPT